MLESPFAPKWNVQLGDKIQGTDFKFVKRFERKLIRSKSHPFFESRPDYSYIRQIKYSSPFYFEKLKEFHSESDFYSLSTTDRNDLGKYIHKIIPTEISLDPMVINPTSGTTGTPILAPNHPRAIGCYVPLIEFSVMKHGVKLKKSPEETIAIQLCNQKETIVYATSHSLSRGAKFAKINLDDSSWRNPSDKQMFIEEMKPQILTGDPYSFESALKMGINYSPKAIHSTALELTNSLRDRLRAHFQCPVINFYSLNETGPIAYSCPIDQEWMHLLPHDLFVEIINPSNTKDSNGYGEITVTGGRNPYLPLIRYKTGDFGKLKFDTCPCGDPFPKLKLLSGRKPVYFTSTIGETVNPIDLARILRSFTEIFQFQVIQKDKNSFTINLSVGNHFVSESLTHIAAKFKTILGQSAHLEFQTDMNLSGKKNKMFINEMDTNGDNL